MQITKADVIWNYGATLIKIGSNALLLPFILKMMPSETVGIWTIFMTVTAFISLFDFGFNPSFTRNVTYIFSGVRNLKTLGYETLKVENKAIDFGLLKGVISAMKWFYLRIAIFVFLLLITLGTYYIHSVLQNYNYYSVDVYIAWILLCLTNAYNLYARYYDSLLLGKGLVKRSKQIIILGQSVYLIVASMLILKGNGLIAIVLAQASSVIIVRLLTYHYFFTREIIENLNAVKSREKSEIIKAIYPNAFKIGLTSLGAFLIIKSSIMIGSLFVSLSDIASYGITMQLIDVIAGLAVIYTTTYQPKIAQLRVKSNNKKIKEIYLKGQIILFFTFLLGGVGLVYFGEMILKLISSNTQLIPRGMVAVALIISFLETNHGVAGRILLSKNEVPFFKASLFSGVLTVVLLLLLFLRYTNLGIWAMIAAPGFAQIIYQNWKWPSVVIFDLNITYNDIKKSICQLVSK